MTKLITKLGFCKACWERIFMVKVEDHDKRLLQMQFDIKDRSRSLFKKYSHLVPLI